MNKRLYGIAYMFISVFVLIMMLRSIYNNSFDSLNYKSTLESVAEENLIAKKKIKEIYGIASRLLSPTELSGVVKEDDGYLIFFNNLDYDTKKIKEKIEELSNVCEANGAEFVYITYPNKVDYGVSAKDYGYEDYSSIAYREILEYLDYKGINYLDISEIFMRNGYTNREIFYKTDYHWNTKAGLNASREIVKYLNAEFDFKMNSQLLRNEEFLFEQYTNHWLGEAGRKLSKAYVGVLDDYTMISPKYETSLVLNEISKNSVKEGDFSILMHNSDWDGVGEIDLYNYNAHYSYLGASSFDRIYNNLIPNGKKVLIIKDSFSVVTIPFLALCSQEVTSFDLRTASGLYEYIENNDFDVVILAYTLSWGAGMYDFN